MFIVRYIIFILIVLISACGGGGGSEGGGGDQTQAPSVGTFSSGSPIRGGVPTISFVIDFSENFSFEDTQRLSLVVDVSTDGAPDRSGDEFTLFWNGKSEEDGCPDEIYCFKYPFVDIEGFCCTVLRNITYERNNINGNVQIILNYYGSFTKDTFNNLENGQFQFNVKSSYYADDSHASLVSSDSYPESESYSDVFGFQTDTVRDFEGTDSKADIASIEVNLDLSRYQ